MHNKWIVLLLILLCSLTLKAENLTDLLQQHQNGRVSLRAMTGDAAVQDYLEKLQHSDAQRRIQVENILNSNTELDSEELLAAAIILLDSNEPTHHQHALELARQATEQDPINIKAHWLVCAAEDRYLLSNGAPQVWGTQLKLKMNAEQKREVYYQVNFDRTAKSDKDRIACGLPGLNEMEIRLARMARLKDRNAQYRIWNKFW